MGEHIAQRIEQLSLTQAEIAAAGGPTDKTLRGYIEGRPIVRADKRRELCRILGWRVESIDSLLAGGDPIPVGERQSAADTTDYNSRLARMPDHVLQAVNDIIDAEERRRGLS